MKAEICVIIIFSSWQKNQKPLICILNYLWRKKMHILVIGGAGYIGSHVVKALVGAKHKVTVFDNLSTGLEMNLFPENGFIKADILDYDAVKKALQNKVDAVVHLAAKKAVGESMEKPEKYALNNICGTLNILNAMAETGVNKLVFSSSAAVYGNPEYLPIDEKHPVNPVSFYGFTKLDIENYMRWYGQLKGLRFVSLRYFNAVGYDEEGIVRGLEKNPQNLLPIVMEALLGKRSKVQIFGNDYDTRDGTCIRDYIHVSDLASAHVSALEYMAKGGESQILNLGTETGISVLEMIKATEAATGRKVPYEFAGRRAGDPAVILATPAKAHEILGWKAVHSSVDNIIKSTWKAYNA